MEVQRVMFEEQKERERTGEFADDPLFQMAGSLSIDAPDLAHRLDEYLAEAYADNHAEENQYVNFDRRNQSYNRLYCMYVTHATFADGYNLRYAPNAKPSTKITCVKTQIKC